MPEMMQTVTITLTDGRSGVFVGRELVSEEELRKGAKVADVGMSIPKPLPEGSYFSKIDEEKD